MAIIRYNNVKPDNIIIIIKFLFFSSIFTFPPVFKIEKDTTTVYIVSKIADNEYIWGYDGKKVNVTTKKAEFGGLEKKHEICTP